MLARKIVKKKVESAPGGKEGGGGIGVDDKKKHYVEKYSREGEISSLLGVGPRNNVPSIKFILGGAVLGVRAECCGFW